MQLPANYYRAEKLQLYCAEDVLTLGKGELLGTLGVTGEYACPPETKQCGLVPDQYNVKIGLEEDRIIFRANLSKGQTVILQLAGSTTHNYFIPTTKRPVLAACMGAFMENDMAAVEFPVSKNGLTGKFSLVLIVDDYRYDLGLTIDL